MYRNLPKIRPWAMNFSGYSKRGVGLFSSVLVFHSKIGPPYKLVYTHLDITREGLHKICLHKCKSQNKVTTIFVLWKAIPHPQTDRFFLEKFITKANALTEDFIMQHACVVKRNGMGWAYFRE